MLGLGRSNDTATAATLEPETEMTQRKININQTFHDKFATYLAHAACGDLILDKSGNLCQRECWDEAFTKELPWEQHRIGARLATITRDGWKLTPYGAQFILENCPPGGPGSAVAIRKLTALVLEGRQ
jgi:hypothetical protein